MKNYILALGETSLGNIAETGGKNASLGELVRELPEIAVPPGFIITVEAFRDFLHDNELEEKIRQSISRIHPQTLDGLSEAAQYCRQLIKNSILPVVLDQQVREAYEKLVGGKKDRTVSVRSSATAEDLPSASFAGQHDSFLNISGEERLLESIKDCYCSLYNDRAIKYRMDHGIAHETVGISVGVQTMVRSDLGAAGVIFTLDPETGFDRVIYLTGAWGFGEAVVQGTVTPDECWIFKTTLEKGKFPIVGRKMGRKEGMKAGWVLTDEEWILLARWSLLIEKHYRRPMDIEWAKDGLSGQLYILQARPETVHSIRKKHSIQTYHLTIKGTVLCSGKAVGRKIVTGKACIIQSLADASKLKAGDILIADNTNPDWNALLRKAVSIVTNKGGRTSHASIVARELGIPAIVGTGNATQVIADGQLISVVNVEGEDGQVMDGAVEFLTSHLDFEELPTIETKAMLILADPDRAFELASYPTAGVGLLRLEFIINNSILAHPMALLNYDTLPEGKDKKLIAGMTAGYASKGDFFVQHLSEAVAKVAAAFYPRAVIARMSDFKTNEYASLLGGSIFEPKEENPMIGFRGASRYYDPRYEEGFGLECAAMKRVRNEMGLTNVKLMIPFCRTLEEARKVLATMEKYGLKRGVNGLMIYMMVEIPSNVILAEQFAALFDGFSIGSNDLTQLTLGLDRDSEIVSHLFNENNEAVTTLISRAIEAARKAHIEIGLCGQAPSDFPEFSRFLVEKGIHSISFTPDALFKGIENIAKAEALHLSGQQHPDKAYIGYD